MKCPICSKESDARLKPFCSARCRDRDLHRWFTSGYAVPAVELDDVNMEELEQAIAPEASEEPDDS